MTIFIYKEFYQNPQIEKTLSEFFPTSLKLRDSVVPLQLLPFLSYVEIPSGKWGETKF